MHRENSRRLWLPSSLVWHHGLDELRHAQLSFDCELSSQLVCNTHKTNKIGKTEDIDNGIHVQSDNISIALLVRLRCVSEFLDVVGQIRAFQQRDLPVDSMLKRQHVDLVIVGVSVDEYTASESTVGAESVVPDSTRALGRRRNERHSSETIRY